MRALAHRGGWVLLVLSLTLLLAAGQTLAGSLVEFANVLGYAKPTKLSGYLSQPDGAGPFPAVVVLHGCGGISSHSIGIADELTRWGYVALTVDSFGPRAMTDACGQLFIGQETDAYAAARFLVQQLAVDQERLAMLGQSMGGSAALAALERGSIERRFPEKFAAAIAYYPSCSGHPPTLTAPTLILIGAADDLNRAEACQEMTSRPHSDGAEIELVVYPRAYHAFDVDWFQPGRDVRGHWFEYNATATDEARDRVRSFLEKNFNRRTPINRNGG